MHGISLYLASFIGFLVSGIIAEPIAWPPGPHATGGPRPTGGVNPSKHNNITGSIVDPAPVSFGGEMRGGQQRGKPISKKIVDEFLEKSRNLSLPLNGQVFTVTKIPTAKPDGANWVKAELTLKFIVTAQGTSMEPVKHAFAEAVWLAWQFALKPAHTSEHTIGTKEKITLHDGPTKVQASAKGKFPPKMRRGETATSSAPEATGSAIAEETGSVTVTFSSQLS